MGFWRKQQITFFLTSQCNLRCRYCYMPKMHVENTDRVIDLDFAIAGLRDFFSSGPSRTIRFFGSGEPTIAFRRMVEIWEIARQMAGDDLRTELETNGYFSDEIADWVEDHIDYLWVSVDGPPEIQDRQRPVINGMRSSPTIVNNIKRFAASKRLQFGVRATIEADNIDKQSYLIDYFHELGVKYVAASPTYYYKVNTKIETPSLLEFAKNFVPAFYHALELGMFYQTLLIVNFDEEVDIYCQASIPTPRLTTDGYVSSCDWASFGVKYLPSRVQQELIYGYFDKNTKEIVYDKNTIDRIRKRNNEYLGSTSCFGCKALKHCGGGCVGKMAAATDSIYTATPDWCESVRYLYDNLPINRGLYPFIHP